MEIVVLFFATCERMVCVFVCANARAKILVFVVEFHIVSTLSRSILLTVTVVSSYQSWNRLEEETYDAINSPFSLIAFWNFYYNKLKQIVYKRTQCYVNKIILLSNLAYIDMQARNDLRLKREMFGLYI